MPLKIIRNDITKVAADAIISTANWEPVIYPGTDMAIHEAAGPELLEARKALGVLAPGTCAATPAYRLPAKYVLHAVGPDWEGGAKDEAAILRSTYDAALTLAVELGCQSVASPLMGTAFHGFPRDLALSVALRAFTDFLMEHEITIFLVLFSGKSFGLAEALFGDLRSYIDDNYVAEKKQGYKNVSPRDRKRRSYEPKFSISADDDASDYDASIRPDAAPMGAFAAAAAKEVSLPDYLRQSESTFTEYLQDLLRERDGKDSEVYKRAEISKQLFSKILSNKYYQPKKTTVLQLAIGLQLDLNRTQKLLEKAGYALTRSSKVDLAVQYYIERGIYSVTFINEALYDSGLPLLTND